jgi:ELWxxDGT repeat protein
MFNKMAGRMNILHKTLLLFLVALAPDVFAAVPYLVKDINVLTSPASSTPTVIVTIGQMTYFFADDGSHGLELWRTDGTDSGTQLVKDMNPGAGSGVRLDRWAFPLRDSLIFTAGVGLDLQVWSTDGTEAGTTMLTDIHLAAPNAFNAKLIGVTADAAYFFATSAPGAGELWRTDGTADGTRRVVDLQLKSGALPFAVGTIGNSIVFYASTASRSGLFLSDGTAEGTRPVGGGGGVAAGVQFGDTIVFTAFEPGNMFGVYLTNGTLEGTLRLQGGFIIDPNYAYEPFNLVRIGNVIFFSGNDGMHGRRLWRTDGTVAGTSVIMDAFPGSGGSQPRNLTSAGNTLFFFVSSANANQLWKSDGTADGTKLVKDLQLPNSYGGFGWHGVFYFAFDDGLHGAELWGSDGTAEGTAMVRDIFPGKDSGLYTISIVPRSEGFVFAASNGVNGFEPWLSDGTAAGTRLVKNVRPDTAVSSGPYALAERNGMLMFAANDGTDQSLWTTDGTEAGTRRIVSTDPPFRATVANGVYFFTATGFPPSALWRSDGTAAGTFSISQSSSVRFRDYLVPFRNGIFFSGDDATHGSEPWFTDGTVSGTRMIADVVPGSSGSIRSEILPVVSRGNVYFVGPAANGNFQLWKTDGTPVGTQAVSDIREPTSIEWRALTDVDGTVYFAAVLHDLAFDLYRCDGTKNGTIKVKSIAAPAPRLMWNVGGLLFFMTRGALWTSDGTEAGTKLVKTVPTPDCPDERDYAIVGNTFYWFVVGIDFAAELWRSDGTVDGTYRLARFEYNGFSEPLQGCSTHYMTAIDGILYLIGRDPLHGTEPWISDGTATGTRMLYDVNPGIGSSNPGQYLRAGDILYFTADDGLHGTEVWAYSVAKAPSRHRPSRP